MVVVVDDGVVIVDAGCAGIVTGDVAMLGGLGGPVTKALGSFGVWVDASVVFVALSVVKSTLGAVFTV